MSRSAAAVTALLALSVLWAYWGPLRDVSVRWLEPEYSHGFFVPAFAMAMLWVRRDLLSGGTVQGSWVGLGLVVVAAGILLMANFWYFALPAAWSLLPCLAGVTLLWGGWRALRWAAPSIVFLAFMIPLPGAISGSLAVPLQRVATEASTYGLVMLGVPAVAQGNVIALSEARIGVVEACNGLRMLILFFATSTAVALLVRRPLWEKLLIVASAAPIAVLSNLVRITITGLLHETTNAAVADRFFHTLGGLLMMPMCLLFLWIETKFLSRMFLPLETEGPVPLTARR